MVHIVAVVRRWMARLMADRDPSKYSSISPRKPGGGRGPIFPYNGSGMGR
jgi:hypothetical protein